MRGLVCVCLCVCVFQALRGEQWLPAPYRSALAVTVDDVQLVPSGEDSLLRRAVSVATAGGAPLTAFIAGPHAGMITGSQQTIDGGFGA